MQKIQRSSEVLLDIANNHELKGKKMSYSSILELFGDRAFGLAILFFALPSALPFSAVPGISLIFSIPIVFFAIQMVVGRRSFWLPNVIARQTIGHETVAKVLRKAAPYIAKIEYFLKPRLAFMASRFMDVINGLLILILALLLMLPIPFSNFILAGLLILFSLGLIEKDGLIILLAYIGTITYIYFAYVIILLAIKTFLG